MKNNHGKTAAFAATLRTVIVLTILICTIIVAGCIASAKSQKTDSAHLSGYLDGREIGYDDGYTQALADIPELISIAGFNEQGQLLLDVNGEVHSYDIDIIELTSQLSGFPQVR